MSEQEFEEARSRILDLVEDDRFNEDRDSPGKQKVLAELNALLFAIRAGSMEGECRT